MATRFLEDLQFIISYHNSITVCGTKKWQQAQKNSNPSEWKLDSELKMTIFKYNKKGFRKNGMFWNLSHFMPTSFRLYFIYILARIWLNQFSWILTLLSAINCQLFRMDDQQWKTIGLSQPYKTEVHRHNALLNLAGRPSRLGNKQEKLKQCLKLHSRDLFLRIKLYLLAVRLFRA